MNNQISLNWKMPILVCPTSHQTGVIRKGETIWCHTELLDSGPLGNPPNWQMAE
ncbi:hypothetical protein ACFPMF_15625 [Larkinella bovis]|uniref:Uncharacterized protein n=1 Tax=Larkinella bovis TaxID=683041 RepID=A0ABW0II10_9BACT